MAGQLKIATTPWEWQVDESAGALCTQAELAEQMGFHSFWVPENHFRRKGSFPAPMLSLAAIAAKTSTIRLGCTSYLLPIRNPLLAAEEVSVLDKLSNGRLILGLGRGIQAEVFDAFGIESVRKRELFAQHLEIMRRAWAGDPIGKSSHGEAIVLSPLPVQKPSPPLWVAAIGPKALRQVAGLGLPYLASPLDPFEKLKLNYDSYHSAVTEAGMPMVTTIPIMRTVFISQSDRQAAAIRSTLTERLPTHMRATAGPAENWAIIGSRDYVYDQLQRYREELNLTHLILRAGLPCVSTAEQLESHRKVLAIQLKE